MSALHFLMFVIKPFWCLSPQLLQPKTFKSRQLPNWGQPPGHLLSPLWGNEIQEGSRVEWLDRPVWSWDLYADPAGFSTPLDLRIFFCKGVRRGHSWRLNEIEETYFSPQKVPAVSHSFPPVVTFLLWSNTPSAKMKTGFTGVQAQIH